MSDRTPNPSIPWTAARRTMSATLAIGLNPSGALLFGCITDQGMAAYWPTAQFEIADCMNHHETSETTHALFGL